MYILTVRSSLGPSPPNAGRYTVASRFRCRSCERGYIFPRAPEQFVASPLCLVGYVRWDARSDRVPPLQTIIFSSFTGRTKVCRQYGSRSVNDHKGDCQDLLQVADVRYWEICDLTFELTFSKPRRRTFRIPPFKQKCDPRHDQDDCPNPIGVNAEQSLSRE
jgi:hypothetical protein